MKKILKESLNGWRPRYHVNGWFYIMFALFIIFEPRIIGSESPLWSRPIKTLPEFLIVISLTVFFFIVLDYAYSLLLVFLARFDKK